MAPLPTSPPAMPRLMAVLNASPESFSGNVVDAASVAALVRAAVAAGASVLDVGGQSLRTDQAEIPVAEEQARAVPVVEACRAALADSDPSGPDTSAPGVAVDISVDTYRAPVAAAAIAAGATVVNDPSGLSDPDLARVVRDTGARLVLTYNRARPKVRLSADELVADAVADGLVFLAAGLDRLAAAGVSADQVVIDPGPDLGKSPAQTVQVLRSLHRFRTFGRPLLLALSRKDFIGAVTSTGPLDRSAGLLGVLAALDLGPEDVLRVHEPGRIRDFYLLRGVVEGRLDVPADLELPLHLRHADPSPSAAPPPPDGP
jgi:dihydropteroate synthase